MLPFVALISITALSACGASSAASGKALRLPLYGPVSVADPAQANSDSSRFVASLLFSGLVKFGPDLHIVPDLAVSIPTISNNGYVYTFAIRSDARFADGRPCTAWDVAYSLDRALAPRTHSPLAHRYLGNIKGAHAVEAGRTGHISGVRVIDRQTIRIQLVHPDATFLDKLALPVAYVVDRRVIDTYEAGTSRSRSDGTGPWTLVGTERNGTLELAPRPHYYGGALQLRSILLVPVRSAQSALDLYRHDALDIAAIPPEQIESLSRRSDFQSSTALDAYYLAPVHGSYFALAATLDRDALMRDVGSSIASLDTIVPSDVPDYVASPPTLVATTSPQSAALPSIRWIDGTPHDWISSRLLRALAAQWPDKGHTGTPVRLIHVNSPLPDPSVWLRVVLKQTASTWFRTMLTRSMQLTNDPVTRMSTYSRTENWALQQGLIIPVASGTIAYLIKSTVESLNVTPLGIMGDNNAWPSVSLK